MHTKSAQPKIRRSTEEILAIRKRILATEKPKQEQRAKEKAEANAIPMPGELPKAFPVTEKTLCGFRLLPCTLGHTQLLQEIKSPLVKVFAVCIKYKKREDDLARTKPKEKAPAEQHALWEKQRLECEAAKVAEMAAIPYTEGDTAALLFIFSRHPEESRDVFAAGDIDAWSQRAKWRQNGVAEADIEAMHAAHVLRFFRDYACAEVIDKLPTRAEFEISAELSRHYGDSFATAISYDVPTNDTAVFTQPPAGPKTA
jgi:hypothetical protein